jgi:uncharacterized protein with HEPN domain
MNKHNNLPYINHIFDEILKIEKSTKNLTKEKFINNEDVIDATIRRLEIIVEAAKNISENFKKEYDDVEWEKIAGMRDLLIHGYFKINLDIIWRVIKDDISVLKNKSLILKRI